MIIDLVAVLQTGIVNQLALTTGKASMRLKFFVAWLCCVVCSISGKKLQGFKPLRIDAVPSLLGIGVAKSGTTDLYHSILEALPEYFNVPERKEAYNLLRDNFEEQEAQETYKEDLHMHDGKPYTLDITPNYFWYQKPVNNAKKFLNGTSTVVMLRDPVSMLHSWFNWRKGRAYVNLVEELSMAAILLAELQLVMEPARYRKLMEMVYTDNTQHGMASYQELAGELDAELGKRNANASNGWQGYLMPALVLPPLRFWDGHFQEGRTLVIISDAYYDNRTDVFVNAMLPFIFGDEVPEWLNEDLVEQRLSSMGVHNAQKYSQDVPGPLSCMLHTFFEPFNCMLSAWLRDNPKIQVYPPERLEKGCDLWDNVDMLKACNIDYLFPALNTLQHLSTAPPLSD